MTYNDYIKNIYKIKNQIQKLQDDFYSDPNWMDKDSSAFIAEYTKLCDELEVAYKYNSK